MPVLVGLRAGLIGLRVGLMPVLVGLRVGLIPGLVGLRAGLIPGLVGLRVGPYTVRVGLHVGIILSIACLGVGLFTVLVGLRVGLVAVLFGLRVGLIPGLFGLRVDLIPGLFGLRVDLIPGLVGLLVSGGFECVGVLFDAAGVLFVPVSPVVQLVGFFVVPRPGYEITDGLVAAFGFAGDRVGVFLDSAVWDVRTMLGVESVVMLFLLGDIGTYRISVAGLENVWRDVSCCAQTRLACWIDKTRTVPVIKSGPFSRKLVVVIGIAVVTPM